MPEIIDNLRRVCQAIHEYSKNAERSTGLTGPQLWALNILGSVISMRVTDLARQMYLHPATVVGIIDRLEVKGLVKRNRSTEDRRSVDLHLTDTGKALAVKTPEVAQVMLVQGLGQLSDEQYSCVEEGMKQMVRMLAAEQIIPQPLHG